MQTTQANPQPLSEVITELDFESLKELRSFIRVANNLKQLAKNCNPAVIREAVKLEKHRKSAIETIRKSWLERKVISENTARKAIDLIYMQYNDALASAENSLSFCLR